MPCYETRTMSVEFQAQHRDLLMKAIQSLGMNVVERQDGKITLDYGRIVLDLSKNRAVVQQDSQGRLNELKRAYSKQAIAQIARINSWLNKQDKTQKSSMTVSGQMVKF